MIWNKYCDIPTELTLGNYPTLIDIINEVLDAAECRLARKLPAKRTAHYFYDIDEPGKFVLVSTSTGPALLPTGYFDNTVFRGQSSYYEKCLPSLFRLNCDKEVLKSYLQMNEMILELQNHPIIMSLAGTRLCNIKIPINIGGLAQHYGIKTSYLDMTNDIWVATFFAATDYINGEYVPHIITQQSPLDEKYGVIYRIQNYVDNSCNNIVPIGLQCFNRPGCQKAFVRIMDDVNDLHSVSNLEKVFFRHDNAISNLLFTLSQRGRKFFPDDSFVGVVNEIIGYDSFCKEAVKNVYEIYYKGLLKFEEFTDMVLESGFEIRDNIRDLFSPEVKKLDFENWVHGGADRFMDDIIVMPLQLIPLGD